MAGKREESRSFWVQNGHWAIFGCRDMCKTLWNIMFWRCEHLIFLWWVQWLNDRKALLPKCAAVLILAVHNGFVNVNSWIKIKIMFSFQIWLRHKWNKVNILKKFFFISWFSNFNSTYLGNQILLRGRSVLKTFGILPSVRPYNYLFCSFLNNGDIKLNLRGNFFWDTL